MVRTHLTPSADVGDTRGMDEPEHLRTSRVVYDHSVEQFLDAVGSAISVEFEAPLDRAVLDAFAESVGTGASWPVLDAGCGPGRVAAHLVGRNVDACGVDISGAMVDAARTAHPHIRFDESSLTALPFSDESMQAVIYWYSIITTPPSELVHVWRELDRVLRADGQVLIAFQAGAGEAVERPGAYGSAATLTLFRHAVDHVVATLEQSGFDLSADVRRRAEFEHETTPQAFLTFTRSCGADASGSRGLTCSPR